MTLVRTLFAGLVALMVMTPALTATAQSSEPTPTSSVQPYWTEGFSKQMQTLLRSGDTDRMDAAMQLIMHYEKTTPLKINFNALIPTLFSIYESESVTDGRRLLALSTLEAIGGEPVMARLAERLRRGREPSERVERQTLRVLTARLQEVERRTR